MLCTRSRKSVSLLWNRSAKGRVRTGALLVGLLLFGGFVFGAVAAVGLFDAATASASFAGKDGQIAYDVKDGAGRWQLWVANSDLSGARMLTHGRQDGGWPAWSPDGKKIAFDSERSDHTPNDSNHVGDVYVMKADGSGVKKLTDSKGESGDAAWSPSGSLLALDADRGNREGLRAIYVI